MGVSIYVRDSALMYHAFIEQKGKLLGGNAGVLQLKVLFRTVFRPFLAKKCRLLFAGFGAELAQKVPAFLPLLRS